MGSLDDSGKPFDLDHQLKNCLQEFTEGRDEYWRARPEGGDWGLHERLYGHAEQVATMLLKATDDLVIRELLGEEPVQFSIEQQQFLDEIRSEIEALLAVVKQKLPGGDVNHAFEQVINDMVLDQRPSDDTLLKLVWDRLCIHVAEDAITRLVRGANRILQLSQLFLRQTPSSETLRFLRRVSRCFIWGFDAECVILCRGAIDTAFREAVSDELCHKHELKRAKFGHTLSNRIKAARLDGMIDDRTKKVAFRVNSPATTAAHENPELVRDVVRVVRDTRDVLQRLLPSEAEQVSG